MLGSNFPGRLGLQQRLLPTYRVSFFDMLATVCSKGLSVLAGEPGPREAITTTQTLNQATFEFTRNWHFGQADSPFYFLWQRGLIPWLKSWQPDTLILEANPRYLASRQAIHYMHARRRPVIGWGLGAPPLNSKTAFASLQLKFRKDFLLSCDALIAYSHKGADEYRALGFPAEKIYIAKNAVTSRPVEPFPEREVLTGNKINVLFVGRLQARKRIDNLLRACASLPVAVQPGVWIVGDGPSRAQLENFAQENYPQAQFFGTLHGAELASKFQEADLFVLPGTGGLAVQEAMAYGLPVIVAEGDGTQNDLVHSGNGWLVPPDDLDRLQQALREAVENPDRLREIGRESFRIVSQEINIESMTAVFVEALNHTRVV